MTPSSPPMGSYRLSIKDATGRQMSLLNDDHPSSHQPRPLNTTYSKPMESTATTTTTPQNASPPARRRYHCMEPGCNKSFTTSGHLARHNRIHTGEKNFHCIYPGCPSRFSRQDNMMQHYRTHMSPKSRRLPYYAQRRQVMSHYHPYHHTQAVSGSHRLPFANHHGSAPLAVLPPYGHERAASATVAKPNYDPSVMQLYYSSSPMVTPSPSAIVDLFQPLSAPPPALPKPRPMEPSTATPTFRLHQRSASISSACSSSTSSSFLFSPPPMQSPSPCPSNAMSSPSDLLQLANIVSTYG
ncbi:uncharacterized protein BYT42DRAFT_570498 [Radiomyces spectabilis]|uniref:uncharacterized protein n=1 Tax=Radiomyces spectabilis TaxID=64574 RepID=UPI0022206D90|nr:uncharacterized protein BYT42DRAFT_570498 [Radiomyces spectabilis]KAI8377489.1 hypothetical protein BYT42DRAFT_570498 [Radiomyces spectabilis]